MEMADIRVLVIGARSAGDSVGNDGPFSGIGGEIARRMDEGLGNPQQVFTPSVEALDVVDGGEWYLSENGPFTHIVYAAGVNLLKWAKDMTLTDYRNTFEVNAYGFGLVLGTHKRLFPDDHFSAVAIVSDAMRNPMRGSTAYCASKAALAAIIKNLAREWAPDCRINGVAPAIVSDTPMTEYIDATVPGFRGWDPEKAAAYEASMLPMGRRVTKAEVAEVVTNVLFGPAYLTGSIIDITGGK